MSLSLASWAPGQLRIVDYNTANGGRDTTIPRDGIDTVLQAIGNETVNGISRPIDLLLLQEQWAAAITTQAYVDIMNDLYPGLTYGRGSVNGDTNGAGRPGIVFNTDALQLIAEVPVGATGTNGAARQPMRYQMRPVGYGPEADFYVYVSHYKASSGAANEARRNFEAGFIRSNADSLGPDARVIYAGDFNIESPNEPMFQTLLAPGNGQAVDPLGNIDWNSSANRFAHTQSPTHSNCPDDSLIQGGVDDRFDFQLVSTELASNEGLGLIDNSYRTFANNGSTFNDPINVGNTSGVAQNVLNALACASDHLPVVADYQLPAKLEAFVSALPANLNVGDSSRVDLTVRNVADVLTANGADELDYTYSVSGNLFGSGNGSDLALGNGSLHSIQLDTTSPGQKSGTITVTSNSPQVPGGVVSIPINYNVSGGGGVVTCNAPEILFSMRESFESAPGNGYSLSNAFDDGSFDFFNRFAVPDTDNAARDDFSQFNGNFGIIGQDHDGGGGSATATVEISNIDISGKDQLQVSGLFGAIEGEPQFQNFESGDGMSVFASIDGAAPVLIGSFAPQSSGSGDLYQDNDLDGVGDGARVTDELAEYSFVVSGQGSSLDITIEMTSNASFETLAVDDIRVTGEAPTIPGDANLDGTVDEADFAIWNTHRFGNTSSWTQGDFNCDGFADVSDFNIWNTHRGQSVNPIAVVSQANAVPEPSGWPISMLACLFVLFRRRD